QFLLLSVGQPHSIHLWLPPPFPFCILSPPTCLADIDGPYTTDPNGRILAAPPVGSGAYNFFTSSANPIGQPPVVGTRKFIASSGAELSGAPFGALVAGFSQTATPASYADFPAGFSLVGTSGSVTAPASGGYLFLGVNDIGDAS